MGAPSGHDLRPRQLSRIDPADRGQLAALLARHRLRARHSLGQNFLADPELRDRVVEAAGLAAEDEVLEIGAGLGTLTVALAELRGWDLETLARIELANVSSLFSRIV